MKKLKRYINRSKSVITGKENLEHLYSFKNFPVFMGCVDTPQEEDIVADMEWMIDSETGVIQLKKLIPLEILYLNQHNDGTGQIWQDHYSEFARFIKKHNPGKNILEIGGAHDWIAKNYMNLAPDVNWTIVEPNPQYIKNDKIRVIKGWFDENFTIDQLVNTIIHSHVLEHVYEPAEYLRHISGFLKEGDKHIFTFPNMLEQLTRKYTNCLNFEHTVFLTEYIVDYLLKKYGFNILAKDYFKDHSIFYSTEKINKIPTDLSENKYNEYKKIFMDFVGHHKEMVGDLNNKIDNAEEPVYFFGAHIFATYLFAFGLKQDKIISILDNSPAKQGKRLYGTPFKVESPKILKNKGSVNLILKAGIYNEEIKKDILGNINNQVVFW